MKLVLCIDSGNGAQSGYPVPIKGVVYEVKKIISQNIYINGVDIWYNVSSIPVYVHHASLFVDVPEDMLTKIIANTEIVQGKESFILMN